jgi:ketosteroid isomerase-like protein
MSHYAPDILSFDAIGLLQYKGRDAYKKHWQACFEMCPGDEGSFQINDLAVTAGDEIGFAHYLASCGGPGPDGEVKAGFMRGTVCCRKVDGKWLVAHEHLSVPFDMESGKALTELTP